MRIKYSVLLFFVIFIFTGCKTTEIEKSKSMSHISKADNSAEISVDNLSLNTYPVEDSLYIVAVSPKFQNNDEEVKYALASAARQISIYYGAHVSYQKFIDENIIGTLQAQKVDVAYDQDLAISILNKLEIVQESYGNDYYAALIKFKGADTPLIPDLDIIENIRPSWVNNPPQLKGFMTGVGISQRRKSVYESWEQADKQAMAEIANTIHTNIQSGTATIERGGASSSASTSVIKSLNISNVYIDGLYIISRWREPDNSYYYSLAITGML